MPDLALSKVQMGHIFSSFLIGYAIFQIPMGAIGDKIGPRLTLGVATLCCGIATFLTGVVPYLFFPGLNHVVLSLCIVRLFLGASEAATFPVSAIVVLKWIPQTQRGFGNSLIFTGSSMGAAIATPLVSWLMLSEGPG